MERLIDAKKANGYVKNYFSYLTETGYVSPGITKRFLLYFFLIDFVETLYPYFTEKDYQEIEKLMLSLFGSGGCLLPYPVFCANGVAGMPYYMGSVKLRSTEQTSILRTTEDDNLRKF